LLAVLLSAIGVLAGCGGGGGEGMRATLTDDRCTYEGPSSATAGRFTIEVANDSRSFGGFFLATAASNAEADDLQATIDRLLRHYRRSGESRLRAPWTPIVESAIGPSETGVIPADVSAGQYFILCLVGPSTDTRHSSSEPLLPDAAYVATRLDVTGVPTYP
jgi:hypothetical protein